MLSHLFIPLVKDKEWKIGPTSLCNSPTWLTTWLRFSCSQFKSTQAWSGNINRNSITARLMINYDTELTYITLNIPLGLFPTSRSTWTESLVSYKKKRMRKSVIYTLMQIVTVLGTVPRRWGSPESESEREVNRALRGKFNLVKVWSTRSRAAILSIRLFLRRDVALYAMAPRFGRLVWLFYNPVGRGRLRAAAVSPSFTVPLFCCFWATRLIIMQWLANR